MDWIKQHKGISILAAATVVAGGTFVLVWFQPQALFIDEVVDDTLPTAQSGAPDPADTSTSTDTGGGAQTAPPDSAVTSELGPGETPPEFPLTLSTGEFIDLAHRGSGTASIIELEDGSRLLRFESLDIDNGPDLRVILSTSPLVDDDSAYDDGEFLDLGDLKGNKGNQNYEIPDDVDIDDYATVAIWCRRFNVTFNAAPIGS
jgi:hypothetical protein